MAKLIKEKQISKNIANLIQILRTKSKQFLMRCHID